MSISASTWARLLAVMERLAASSDLGEVLSLIIDSMRDSLAAERASVFEYDKANHELFIRQGHGLPDIRFGADRGLAGEAARTRAIINVPDCYADSRFNPEVDRLTGYRTRCMLTIPLVSLNGDLEGVAQVLNKLPVADESTLSAFDDDDLLVTRALASQAAIAIRRARMLKELVRKEQMEASLRVARDMQESALPAILPDLDRYDIAAAASPAEETGGDAFDVMQIGGACAPVSSAAPRPHSECVLVLMADATGHGVGPALSVTQVQAMLRMAGRLRAPLTDAVCHLNALMCETLPAGRFVTAFIGELDSDVNAVRYVSAGQAPILLVRADGSHQEWDASVPPLGIAPDLEIQAADVIPLAPGDVLCLLSDGYYELRTSSGTTDEMFGLDRVLATIRASLPGSANDILESLIGAAERFAGGRPADDDQTAIIIKRLT
ncbi:MAG: SpoIIE family protein phosphatase [Phycisphaerales bacterium]|nr:SpoIIE family protein phosphatase [Phycisphaerales bacterium]